MLKLRLPDPSGAVLVPASALTERYDDFWLTRPDGSRVRVVRLGEGAENTVRVSSDEVKAGDMFRLNPEQ
jgi:hypothetical protein